MGWVLARVIYVWNEGRVLVFANLGFGYLGVDWEISHC